MNIFPYPFSISRHIMDAPPNAYALVNGSQTYPDISGIVRFYDTPYKGIILYAEFFHLPLYTPYDIPSFYGFHIHVNGDCSHHIMRWLLLDVCIYPAVSTEGCHRTLSHPTRNG